MIDRQAIIRLLHAGPRHLVGISNAFNVQHETAAQILHDMEDAGEVIQYETGLYQLSAATQQAEQQRARRGGP